MGAGCCGGGGHGDAVQRPAMTEEQEKIAKWVRRGFERNQKFLILSK